MNFCFIIPNYNHGDTLSGALNQLQPYQLPCFVVDDGSREDQRKIIEESCRPYPWVTLHRLEENSGKGGAVMAGLRLAKSKEYSHAIQVDADGQHDLVALDTLIEKSKEHPRALISGRPVYGEDVPKSRLWGRYITHAWVWLETLSFQIQDSMCGFRAYPLESTIDVLDSAKIGKKMDFDIEVMVRMYWWNVAVYFIPVKVSYPEGGVSNFDPLKDNVLITWMHTRLFFGMLLRLPILLGRKWGRSE